MLLREWVGPSSPRGRALLQRWRRAKPPCMVRRGTAVCFWLQESVALLWWEGWPRRSSPGDRCFWEHSFISYGGRDNLLSFLQVNISCFLHSCISSYNISGNTLKKKRERYLYMIVNNLAMVKSGVISSWMYLFIFYSVFSCWPPEGLRIVAWWTVLWN